MEVLPWILLAMLVAAIAVLLVARVRMKSALAEAQAAIEQQKQQQEERVQEAAETARRDALDEFLRDLRIEDRNYFRESKSMFSARRLLIWQERLCFRDIPLSNWVEREMTIEEGAGPEQTVKPASVFAIPPGPVKQVNLNRPVSS